MSWFLVFSLFAYGNQSIATQKFDSELACKNASKAIIAILPKDNAQVNYNWTCTNLRAFDWN